MNEAKPDEQGIFNVARRIEDVQARRLYLEQACGEDRELQARLEAAGARIDGWYFCPHHPAGQIEALTIACECRKPGPALARQAARDLGIDLERSWMIGDRWGDVGLAATAGLAGGILVRTGYGRSAEARQARGTRAAFVADDVMDAAGWILRQDR